MSISPVSDKGYKVSVGEIPAKPQIAAQNPGSGTLSPGPGGGTANKGKLDGWMDGWMDGWDWGGCFPHEGMRDAVVFDVRPRTWLGLFSHTPGGLISVRGS
jgi:hypothetical protein